MTRTNALAFLPAALLVACAHTGPVPHEQLAASESAVRGAQEAGAENAPQARLHLKLAQDQIAEAQKLMTASKNDEAARELDRAKADAELAIGLSREAKVEAEAQQALARVEELQKNPSGH